MGSLICRGESASGVICHAELVSASLGGRQRGSGAHFVGALISTNMKHALNVIHGFVVYQLIACIITLNFVLGFTRLALAADYTFATIDPPGSVGSAPMVLMIPGKSWGSTGMAVGGMAI